jgi:hypothetical protein
MQCSIVWATKAYRSMFLMRVRVIVRVRVRVRFRVRVRVSVRVNNHDSYTEMTSD